MTQELLYSEGDLRFAVATAKTEIERLTAERDAIQATLDGAKLFEQSHRHALTVIDRLEFERDDLGDDLAQAKRYIETLTAERDAMILDAARYRWLREATTDELEEYANVMPVQSDDYVDEAIAKESKT